VKKRTLFADIVAGGRDGAIAVPKGSTGLPEIDSVYAVLENILVVNR